MLSVARNTKHFRSGSSCPSPPKGILRVYSMFFCPYAQIARIILNLKKIKYETVNIHLTDKPDWFLKINPLAKVPTLQDNNKIIYESMIISDYLNEVYPQPQLYPDDPWAKAEDRCLITVFTSKVHPGFYKMFMNPEPSEVTDIVEKVKNELDFFELELSKRGTTYFFGDVPGMVDFAIFPWFERFPVMGALFPEFKILTEDRFPKLMKYDHEIRKHEAVASTIARTEDHVGFIKSKFDGEIDYDIGCN